ncbi:GNAT family N-acetyltransferase [Pseudomonas hunanensis]|uniref:GNAT family N-acetyltransferase n=1 Tax=Pseudomonas hunanensis TaxID=1247546 RepID=UPI0030DBC784
MTDLSMFAIPPSNLLHEVYRWALPVEVGGYLQRIGSEPSEPVELIVAFADDSPTDVVGFVLYSPVPTHPEACGINYMAVKASHRRRGIGRKLMEMVVDRHNHTELTCAVKKVPFYESLGFRVLDSHNTQVVMNTRDESTTGLMAVLNVTPIYESNEAKLIHDQLVQRWGRKEMINAAKQLERHTAQLTRQAQAFVQGRS